MKFQMLGDANKAGPVRLSDVYDSEVGGASTGIAASQKALYDAYNSLNSRVEPVDVADQYTKITNGVSISTLRAYKLGRLILLDVAFSCSKISGDTNLFSPNNNYVTPVASSYIAYGAGHHASSANKSCYFSYYQGFFMLGNGGGETGVNYRVHTSYISLQ